MLGGFFCQKMVKADSGWDSDYDAGSSWDSDSSWDSSSSWDSASSWSSGGSYYGSTLEDGGAFFTAVVIFIVLVIIIASLKRKSVKTSNISLPKAPVQVGLSSDEIKTIDPSLDKEKLKEQVFNIYKDVQIAWMNFDDATLRKELTDELYNMYSSQLKTLKLKNQKNTMKDILLKNCQIKSINIANGKEEVVVYLNVSQYDYVEDKSGKIVRGTDKYKNNVEYLITFIRNVEKKKIDKCPNCGAKIEIESGGICPYCDSTIVNNNEDFVMSKKECVGQCREF